MLKRWVETSLSDSTGRCRREHVDGTSRTALRVRASTGNRDTRDRRDSSGRCEIHEPLLCSFTVLKHGKNEVKMISGIKKKTEELDELKEVL